MTCGEASVVSSASLSAKELRENANECLGWACTAKSDREREIFLQMARAWNEAAKRLVGTSRPPDALPRFRRPSDGHSPDAAE